MASGKTNQIVRVETYSGMSTSSSGGNFNITSLVPEGYVPVLAWLPEYNWIEFCIPLYDSRNGGIWYVRMADAANGGMSAEKGKTNEKLTVLYIKLPTLQSNGISV